MKREDILKVYEVGPEALRHEVKPFHIRVSLVEPGYIKTRLRRNQQFATDRITDYDPWRKGSSGAR